MLETTRTYRTKVVNHQQASNDLNDCGFSAFKPWNVVRWDDDGEIPDDSELEFELKEHERHRYSDLHCYSSSFERQGLRFL
jgi:transposase